MGEGMLLYKAVELKEQGKSFDEIVEWVENNKLHVCHDVTVDDLFHLHRGGRVSKASAIVGSMIKIKPIIHVNDEGKLVSLYVRLDGDELAHENNNDSTKSCIVLSTEH
jgi:DegV family protein with EDD domain